MSTGPNREDAVITVEKPCDMSFRCICDWRRFMFRFRSWYVGCTIVLIVSDECTWSTIYQAHACCSHPMIVSNRPHFSRCMPIIVGYIYIIFVGLGIFSCLLPQSCSPFSSSCSHFLSIKQGLNIVVFVVLLAVVQASSQLCIWSVCVFIHIYIYIYICIHMYIYIYVYTYIQTWCIHVCHVM